jgi:hypothetical protein
MAHVALSGFPLRYRRDLEVWIERFEVGCEVMLSGFESDCFADHAQVAEILQVEALYHVLE